MEVLEHICTESEKAFDSILLRLNDLDIQTAIRGKVELDRNQIDDLNGLACELHDAHEDEKDTLREEIEELKHIIASMETEDVRQELAKATKAANERGSAANDASSAAFVANRLFETAHELLTPKGKEKFANYGWLDHARGAYAKFREKGFYGCHRERHEDLRQNLYA